MSTLSPAVSNVVSGAYASYYTRSFVPNMGTLPAGSWNTNGSATAEYASYSSIYGPPSTAGTGGSNLIFPSGQTTVISAGTGLQTPYYFNTVTQGTINVVGRIAQVHISIGLNNTAANPAFTAGNEVRVFGGEGAFPKPAFRRPRFNVRFADGYGVETHGVVGNYWAELMDNGALQLCIIEATAASTAAMTVANITTLVTWAVSNNIINILIDGSYVVAAHAAAV